MAGLIKEKSIPLGEILYCLSFAPLLFAKGIGLYDGQRIFNCFVAMALLFGIAKLVVTKYTLKDILFIVGLVVLSLVVYKYSTEKGILFYTWMIIGLKNVRIKEVMRWGLKIWSISFAGILIFSLFHLHDSLYKVHDKLGMGHIFRWGLGYPHPNVLHISYLILLFFIIYQLRERFNWKICLAMFLGNCYIFLYSVSYTGFAIVTIYLAGNLYWKYRGRFGKIEQVLCEMIFPACVLLSIAGPLVLKGRAFDIVNKILNTRLYLSSLFLIKENIAPFGNNIGLLTSAVATMDNSYVYGLIAYGVVTFAVISVGYLFLIHRYVKEQKGIELMIIFAILAAGLTEPFLFNTSYKNISLLFLGEYLFRKKNGADEKIMLKVGGKAMEDIDFRLKSIDFKEIGQRFGEAAKEKKVYRVLLSAVIAIVCMVLYNLTALDYAGVIVPRVHCADVAEDSAIYLENGEPEEYEGYLILDYKDKETPMEHFEGNILKMETVRGNVSYGLMGCLLGYYLFPAVCYILKRKA